MSNPDHSQPVGCGIDERGADRPIVLLVRKDYRAGSCSRQVYLTVCAQSYGKNVARMSTTAHRFAHYLYLRAQRTRSTSSVTCTQARSVHAYATTRARGRGPHSTRHATRAPQIDRSAERGVVFGFASIERAVVQFIFKNMYVIIETECDRFVGAVKTTGK